MAGSLSVVLICSEEDELDEVVELLVVVLLVFSWKIPGITVG